MSLLTHWVRLALLSSALFVSSCNNSDPQPTQLTLLTSRNWQLTGDVVTASGAVNYIHDLCAMLNACSRDNFYQFRTDKSYTLDEGGSKCNPTATRGVFPPTMWREQLGNGDGFFSPVWLFDQPRHEVQACGLGVGWSSAHTHLLEGWRRVTNVAYSTDFDLPRTT
jgi:hypothetical protein